MGMFSAERATAIESRRIRKAAKTTAELLDENNRLLMQQTELLIELIEAVERSNKA